MLVDVPAPDHRPDPALRVHGDQRGLGVVRPVQGRADRVLGGVLHLEVEGGVDLQAAPQDLLVGQPELAS